MGKTERSRGSLSKGLTHLASYWEVMIERFCGGTPGFGQNVLDKKKLDPELLLKATIVSFH